MKKWKPVTYVDVETGEVLPRNFKELYYYKKEKETEVQYWDAKNNLIICTTQLIKIHGRKEQQLNLFRD